MTRRHIWILLLLLALPGAVRAGWSGYLRLDGVKGESQDTNHVGWINVQAIAGEGIVRAGVTNQPSESPLCLVKTVDSSSPVLALDCAKGNTISSGTLDLATTTNSPVEFFRLNLTNVMVTSISQSDAASGGSTSDEELCLNASVISWNYARFNPDNGLPAGYATSLWDFSTGSGTNSTMMPLFMDAGIRTSAGVELDWTATAGASYRIYAVTDLTRPFAPLTEMTATNSGPMSYNFTPQTPAMFFVVEQVPAGF